MKKIYLMALTVVLGLSVNAQNMKKKSVVPEATKLNTIVAKKGHSVQKTSAVIWSDDFSNASTWTTAQSAGATAWTFGTTGGAGGFALPALASTSAANGFALFDSDNGCDGDQIADMTTASSINCTGHPLVRLGFQQYYRRYIDSTFIFVSNNGTTWSKFIVNDTYIDDQSSANPDNVLVDISAVAGNQATVWVRFEFYSPASLGTGSGCAYNWMIDDAYIEDLPAHDVQVNALAVVSGTAAAPAYNCNLGTQLVVVQIKNLGPVAESNIPVNYNVNGVVSTPTVYAASIPAGDSAQVLMPMPSNFSATNYYVVQAWTALATDADMSNDTSAIGLTNTIPTALTSTTYSNGIESNYDFASLNLDWAGSGLAFGLTATHHTGTYGLYYTIPAGVPTGTYTAYVNLPCMDVTNGDTYRISYWKKSQASGTLTINGQSAILTGTAQTGADMTTILKPYAAITPTTATGVLGWKKDSVDYVATATETRYFAIGGMGTINAASDQINVRVDEIKIWKVSGTVGVKTIAANDAISIFPNPTSGILNINAVETNSSVEVYNVIGDKVYTSSLVKGNNTVDLSSLSNGAYFVKLNSNNQIITKKVVLSK